MKIIAYDLGTGGVKASLYDESLHTLSKSFIEYDTTYPAPGLHEQRPEDWWQGIIQSTKALLRDSGINPTDVGCISLSGHSLVTVPIDKKGTVLQEWVPIWSDTRATEEAKEFFGKIEEHDWYMTTGNGFPAPCYSIFKLMWLKKHEPKLFSRIDKVLGSKDYINFRLTGKVYTDNSYASGIGAYNLLEGRMQPRFLDAAGLAEDLFPEIVPSHTIIGTITKETALEIGLPEGTSVACGGVDNACMAMGAVGAEEGRVYTSLGSSSWIPVNSSTPILDFGKKPYVFAHIQEGMFTSAFSIFAGGSSLRWVRETICKELADETNAYKEIDRMAELSPPGANGVLFNPSLAGGTSQDKSVNIRGAFIGLHLGATQNDLLRAAMEGITLNLKLSFDFMRQQVTLSDRLLICGGGSKSRFWLQLFADIFGVEIIKTNIDQDAASIGAAAIAARAIGLWKDYSGIEALHQVENRCSPNASNTEAYRHQLKIFQHIASVLADLGDYMQQA